MYRKLIETEDEFVALRKCHKDPKALTLAAKFAVMTRYVKSNLVSSYVRQMEIFSGESTTGDGEKEVDKDTLREEGRSDPDVSKRAGMRGADPRLVIGALTKAIANEGEGGCLTLKKTIATLRAVFKELTQAGISPEELIRMGDFLKDGGSDSIFPIYQKMDETVVHGAFLETFGPLAKAWRMEYIQEDEIWCRLNTSMYKGLKAKPEMDALGKPREPNAKFLAKIEKYWSPPVTGDGAVSVHRQQVLYAKSVAPDFFESFMPLITACDKALLTENKDLLLMVTSEKVKGNEPSDVKERKITMVENLMSDNPEFGGHCPICANEKMRHMHDMLSK
jgi:predicted Ser/Thr protein kinase